MQNMTSDEILDKINGFTATLAGANFEGMSVENSILKLDDGEKRRLFKQAFDKAGILLEIEGNDWIKMERY